MDCSPPGSLVHRISQECWNGLPFSSSGDLPDPRIESMLPELQVNSLPLSHLGGPYWSDTIWLNKIHYLTKYLIKQITESRLVVSDSATPWTLRSMEFSRPEYWSGWPFSSPGDIPNPGLPHCRWNLY